jgi:hypothetical protein
MRVPQRSRLLAVVLIALTLLGAAGGTWHAPDDPDCFDGFVLHDHSAHHARFGTPTASSAPEHCVICHWLRTFRIDGARHASLPFASDTYARFTAALPPSPVSVAAPATSPRAPPLA